jgi:O-antigen ligase
VLFGLIAIGFFAGALTLSWPSLEKRMEERGNFLSQAKALSNNLRVSFFSDTYDMAKARPVYGWGHGTYRQVFPRFQGDYLRHPSGRIAVTVDKAHNDWLQTWAEVGLVGLLALAVPPMIVLLRAWRSSGSTGRWALVGVGFVAIYALVDFPLRNYAIIAHLTVLICTARRTGASTG